MNSFASFRILLPVCTGLACGALGWCLRDSSPAGTTTSLPGMPAAAPVSHPADTPIAFASSSHSAGSTIDSTPPSAVSTQQVIDRLVVADSKNMINLVEAIGDVTRLTDEHVKVAWTGLLGRPPMPGMGGSAAVIYLWSRMSRMGVEVQIPHGWGAEAFASTIALEQKRVQAPELRRKLEAGLALDDNERRIVFTDALHTDPYAAVMLWMKHTKPWDFQADGRLFGNALSDPATRDVIMAQARQWQTDKDLMGSLVATLARDWITRDPVAAEQWVNLPAQADVRTRVMEQIVNVRALSNPADALRWSGSLPEKERHQTLGMSAGQLANNQPGDGAQLIASLRDPRDREVAVREYGRVLAASNLGQWKQWRDTLPEHERAITNASAFQLWVFHEPGNAVDWLNKQRGGPAKDTMIDTLIDVFAERDAQVAAEWIQSIADPKRRKEAAISALAAIGPEQLDSMRTILNAVPK